MLDVTMPAYAAARRFMSKPMVQTEGRCSMAKVTTMAWRVPTKQMRVVRESGAAYCFRV
uniref:Uncharacterized protein n=1 Tax=Arundo donax TaxID=35708 RepID=A0A0A9HX99_ARUDO